MNPGTRLTNYILFAVSFLAAIWFFAGYPTQDPRSAVDLSITTEQAKTIATEKLADLGYSTDAYTIGEATIRTNRELLDSLQAHLGRPQAGDRLRSESTPNIHPFYWVITFTRKGTGEEPPAAGPPGTNSDSEELQVVLSEEGSFLSLDNSAEFLPGRQVRRSALEAVIAPSPGDTAGRGLMAAVSDSLLGRLLYFDMQKEAGDYSSYSRQSEEGVMRNFRRGIPYRHSVNDARAMADHYLNWAGWHLETLQADTIFIQRVGTVNAANVRYTLADSALGQSLRLDVVVGPTGALLQMDAEYNAASAVQQLPGAVEILRTILLLVLLLSVLVIFFFRMRARAIDSQSALVAAVIMGLLFPLYTFLLRISEYDIFSKGGGLSEYSMLFLEMGIMGAMSSVVFFVLVAVGDSLTRQYWPDKLLSYDYLRQGMVINKPIGMVLLRALALSFVMAGAWTLFVQLYPGMYVSFSQIFLSEHTAWPPLFLMVRNAWFSFGIILLLFLIIGSLVYGRTGNRWAAAGSIILAAGAFPPFLLSVGPSFPEFLMGMGMGAVLVLIYLKWDFLTVLITHFLFMGLLGTVSGWLVSDSPDLFLFIFFIGSLIAVGVIGALAIFLGKEARLLPEYVPSYVEELAQEERIKQELQIARDVQQSFLPSRTPAVAGLDIGALCQPAYETGGDYYDFIPLDDHRVAVAIGDVSGKGIQAAFYMTLVKGMLHSLCRETDSPAEVLCKANRLFCDNAKKGTFVSLIYGIVDVRRGTFTFARAGHNPILRVNTTNGHINELQPGGLGIGLTKNEIFDNKIEEIELSITDDDLFLLYTDGITEALNQAHQFYGTEKLKALIKKQKSKSASEIVTAISRGVTRFMGKAKQHDDMTLMAIQFGRNKR